MTSRAACATPPARRGAPRRSWSRMRTAPPPAPRARAARAGAASSVFPDALGQPQDGQRGDGQREQRDAEVQPPDGGARAVRIGGEPLLRRLRLALEGRVETPRDLQLAVDVRAYRALVIAATLARRHAGVRTLEARERHVYRCKRAGPARAFCHALRLAEQASAGPLP